MLGLTIHAIGHTFQEKLKYIKNLFVSVPLILFLTGYSSYILMFASITFQLDVLLLLGGRLVVAGIQDEAEQRTEAIGDLQCTNEDKSRHGQRDTLKLYKIWLEPEDGDITDRDVEVEFDESVGRPADAVEEAHQRQEEGHVLDALGLDHFTLHATHNTH